VGYVDENNKKNGRMPDPKTSDYNIIEKGDTGCTGCTVLAALPRNLYVYLSFSSTPSKKDYYRTQTTIISL
jgi:hypothetical protein